MRAEGVSIQEEEVVMRQATLQNLENYENCGKVGPKIFRQKPQVRM
jgi:hypothetical protein